MHLSNKERPGLASSSNAEPQQAREFVHLQHAQVNLQDAHVSPQRILL